MSFLKKTKGISKTEDQCACCSTTGSSVTEEVACCTEEACCTESMDCCSGNEKSYSTTESKENCSCSCSSVNDGKCC